MNEAHEIKLSETERVIWLCPRGEIVDSKGTRLDLDADVDAPEEGKLTWATAVQSLRDFIAGYHAPFLLEHTGDGLTNGEIVRVAALTEEEQVSAGIPAEKVKGEALFAVADLHPVLAAAYDDRRLTRTSPHIVMGYLDDAGTTWPLAVLELSAVSKPRQTSRHITTNHLRGVQLSESTPRITMPTSQEVEMGDMETRMAALEEAIATLMGDYESRMAEPDEEAKMGEDKPDSELSELAQQVAELTRENAQIKAKAKVDAVLSERIVPADKVELLKSLALGDDATFAGVVSMLPKAERITAPAAGIGSAPQGSLVERAKALAAEKGIKFSEALSTIGKQGVTL